MYPKAAQPSNYTFNAIPKFFNQVNYFLFIFFAKNCFKLLNDNKNFKLPKEDDLLQQRLREEARALFLQKKNKELLTNEELDVCCKQFYI